MAELLKAKFMQMTEHPLIAEAFGDKAIVKNECDILFHGKIKRPDRYAELPDVIYLIDYKPGKPSNKHHEQLLTYASALKELTDKEIRAFLWCKRVRKKVPLAKSIMHKKPNSWVPKTLIVLFIKLLTT